MSDTSPIAAIDVHLKYFPLAFILSLFKPRLEVDNGQPVTMAWGVARIPVMPGRHQLRAYVPYLFFRTMGAATIVVDVAPGQVVQAAWSAPWLAFLPGKWQLSAGQLSPGASPTAIAQTMAASTASVATADAAPTAAWHPDPTGRHQLRYWDGQTWTPHVSDNGLAATDPIS